MSILKEKVLLLLFSGLALGFTYNSRRQWFILKNVSRKWKEIDARQLRTEIKRLYASKLVEKKKNEDGSYTLVLTDKGKFRVLTYNFERIRYKQGEWDKKWRLVAFDVPEKARYGRDVLRDKLKRAGFCELQKSVFIFPYDCKDEVDYIIEFFNLRRYVRFAVLDFIDNELHLKSLFGLN